MHLWYSWIRTVITSTWQDIAGTPFKFYWSIVNCFAFFLPYIIKKIYCWPPDIITAEYFQQSNLFFCSAVHKNTSGNIPDICYVSELKCNMLESTHLVFLEAWRNSEYTNQEWHQMPIGLHKPTEKSAKKREVKHAHLVFCFFLHGNRLLKAWQLCVLAVNWDNVFKGVAHSPIKPL